MNFVVAHGGTEDIDASALAALLVRYAGISTDRADATAANVRAGRLAVLGLASARDAASLADGLRTVGVHVAAPPRAIFRVRGALEFATAGRRAVIGDLVYGELAAGSVLRGPNGLSVRLKSVSWIPRSGAGEDTALELEAGDVIPSQPEPGAVLVDLGDRQQ